MFFLSAPLFLLALAVWSWDRLPTPSHVLVMVTFILCAAMSMTLAFFVLAVSEEHRFCGCCRVVARFFFKHWCGIDQDSSDEEFRSNIPPTRPLRRSRRHSVDGDAEMPT